MSKVKPRYQDHHQVLDKILAQGLRGEFPKIICFWGPSEFLVNKGIESFQSLWADKSGVSPQRLSSKEISSKEDFDILWQQQGMFEPEQCYLFPKLERIAELVKYLQKIPSKDSLNNVFCFNYLGEASQAKFHSEIKRLGGISIPCFKPYDNELPHLLNALIRKHWKINLSDDAKALLLTVCGSDLFKLDNEGRKLSLIYYQGELSETESRKKQGMLYAKDIAQHLGYLREDHIFAITDHLLNGQVEKAQALVLSLLKRRESSIAILGVISRHVRQAIKVSQALSQGRPMSELSRTLRLPYGLISKYSKYCREISAAKLKDILFLCQQADMSLKSSRKLPEDLVLAEIFYAFRV